MWHTWESVLVGKRPTSKPRRRQKKILNSILKVKESHYRPGQALRFPIFQNIRHMKVVRLSALRTGRLYHPGIIPGTHFCYRLSHPQGHIAVGRIMSLKYSNDTIGNRTRDLPVCSAVPQPPAPLRASKLDLR